MSAVVLYQAGTGINYHVTDHAAQKIRNCVRNNMEWHLQSTHAQHL